MTYQKKYRWARNKPYVDEDGSEWDKDWIVRAIKWRLRWKQDHEGLYYDDPLAGSDGITFHLFCYENTTDAAVDRALISAYQTHDIVGHKVWEIPESWVELARQEL